MEIVLKLSDCDVIFYQKNRHVFSRKKLHVFFEEAFFTIFTITHKIIQF